MNRENMERLEIEELKIMLTNTIKSLGDEAGERVIAEDRITELEQQKEKMIKLLVDYLKSDYENGVDHLTICNEYILLEITCKPIEELLNEI